MSKYKFNKVIKRITTLGIDSTGNKFIVIDDIHNDGSKKKGSKGLRRNEKLIRRLCKGEARHLAVYADRHDRSNRKKKNGWLMDAIPNMIKARKKSLKIILK
jgi:hypothetical protein